MVCLSFILSFLGILVCLVYTPFKRDGLASINKNTYDNDKYYKQEYKNIVKRCKRTLKVSIAKNLEENEGQ